MTLKIVIALDYNCSVFSCEIAWTFLCLYISKYSPHLLSQTAFCFQRSVLIIHGGRGMHTHAHCLSALSQRIYICCFLGFVLFQTKALCSCHTAETLK